MEGGQGEGGSEGWDEEAKAAEPAEPDLTGSDFDSEPEAATLGVPRAAPGRRHPWEQAAPVERSGAEWSGAED